MINVSFKINWPSKESRDIEVYLVNASLSLFIKAEEFSSFPWAMDDSLE